MKLCELVSEPDVLVILVNYELNARLVIKLTLLGSQSEPFATRVL